MAAAHVKILSISTGLARTITTSVTGDYSFPSLLAGEYELSVEASGFQRTVRKASVEAGETTTTDFNLTIGDVKESVTVDGVTPQIQYDSNTVGGVVTQGQIEGLPLNGRSFLELAKLEPGVEPPSRSNNNRTFVPVLGAPGGNTGFSLARMTEAQPSPFRSSDGTRRESGVARRNPAEGPRRPGRVDRSSHLAGQPARTAARADHRHTGH